MCTDMQYNLLSYDPTVFTSEKEYAEYCNAARQFDGGNAARQFDGGNEVDNNMTTNHCIALGHATIS
jgi:hypothetical protein